MRTTRMPAPAIDVPGSSDSAEFYYPSISPDGSIVGYLTGFRGC